MRRIFSALVASAVLCGCAQTEGALDSARPGTRILGDSGFFGTSGKPAEVRPASLGGNVSAPVAGYVEYGSPAAVRAPGSRPIGIEPGGETMTLDFVNADVQDFVRAVFDEILHEPVVIDPNVTGKVTVRTGQPVDRSAAVEIARQMLEMNGASLSREGKVWRIATRAGGPSRPAGAARIVTLRNADGEEVRAALQAFSNGTVAVTALPGGRSLVLSGAPQDVEPLLDLVASLDVDRMRGQSFALLPLREAGAVAVAKDLAQVFAASGRNVQVIPVARMNALLVIANTPGQIQQARQWVARLDRETKSTGRMFVYPVQNRRAADLAGVLRAMFAAGKKDGQGAAEGSAISPAFQVQRTGGGGDAPAAAAPASGQPMNQQALMEAAFRDAGAESVQRAETRIAIQADVATNSLVVTATPEQWRTIAAAISRLDVQPTQVLIEATIAEVQLNDTLRHGVRWYFETGNHSFNLSDLGTGAVTPTYPGGSYVFSVPSARVVLSALEQVTDVEVVSSPALTVLDNQTATLKVGDQVPIATRSSRSVTNPDAPVVNDIELKDTGVILSVTPRVNASGLVQLDISQEVSDVVATTTSDIDSPTIRQRKIDSTVAVGSGAEIVLGGLIGTRREKGDSGIPLLKDIPLLGNAFKSSASAIKNRSELLIILRPTVMGSGTDVAAVTRAVRAGMAGADRALRRN
ncbi:type II secretion system secretin GspD [Labrys wisconsinensis]|uniref:General secretion pathway protein D n=1 Tax=Labrys wisconsinensis TaxID=425677 RepID=A0ABU0JJ71_9HYPH|nr:type II secretion system secretin GspD [Labrys wisconsinensis]MDQ0473536.1 general secretion pathway protein D [Labrys wisconsinensis]